MTTPWRIEVCSPPDRDKLVGELWHGENDIAEIDQESAQLHVTIFADRNGQPYRLPLDDLIAQLREAAGRLTGRKP
ncbi:MAG: hypothetical protein KDA41_04890 [Planctomycetales bacterium]|nr:hypothetical protein [Planctomycetales bacterium]